MTLLLRSAYEQQHEQRQAALDFIAAVKGDAMGRFCERYGLGRLEWQDTDQMAFYRRVAAAVLAGEAKDQERVKAEAAEEQRRGVFKGPTEAVKALGRVEDLILTSGIGDRRRPSKDDLAILCELARAQLNRQPR